MDIVLSHETKSKIADCYARLNYTSRMIQPKLGEYQLLGDSIFVRFANNILHQPSKVVDGTATLGFCVSGQRIKQLTSKIKNSEYTLTKKIILLIGTNDVLCGRSLQTMIRHFKCLLQLLRQRNVAKMVILTLPPVPKLSLMKLHWEVIRGFNQFILGLDSSADHIRVVDILALFLKQDSPVIAAPPQNIPYRTSIGDTPIKHHEKRKSKSNDNDSDNEYVETPKRKRSVLNLDETQEDDLVLSPFCRYLNRVNRNEAEQESVSSDEEDRCFQIRPYIDYIFWNQLKKTISIETEEVQSPIGSPMLFDSPSAYSPLALSSPNDSLKTSISKLSDFHKSLVKYSSCFLRLDYYEMFFFGNQRLDMIHPNIDGLRRIRLELEFLLKREV